MKEIVLSGADNETKGVAVSGVDKILLTDTQITEWESERRSIEAKLEEKKRELQRLNYLLSAAYLFDPSKRKALPARETQETMSEAIVRILSTTPDPMPRNEIRKRLRQSGMKNPALDGGYFYTLLSQLVRKGDVCEMNDLYTAAPFDSPVFSRAAQRIEAEGNGGLAGGSLPQGRPVGPLRALILETLRRSETPIDKRVLKAHITTAAASNPAIKLESYAPLIHLLKKANVVIERDGELDLTERPQSSEALPEGSDDRLELGK
jgi:hypothetical protein